MDTIFTTISANVYHFYWLDFREKGGRVYMLSLEENIHTHIGGSGLCISFLQVGFQGEEGGRVYMLSLTSSAHFRRKHSPPTFNA